MMKCVIFIAFLALANADVIQLTDSNFASEAVKHDILLVKFYAPWCGHCKKLAPEFEKAASLLDDNENPIALAEIDCDSVGKSTCSEYKITGFPTLKIFKSGSEFMDFKGPRNAEGIAQYMRTKAGPSSKELSSAAEFKAITSKINNVIIGFFDNDKSDDAKVFAKVAQSLMDDCKFAHVNNADVVKEIGQSVGNIVIYQPRHLRNKFDPSERLYEGRVDSDELKKFIQTKIHGYAGVRGSPNAGQFPQPLIVAYYEVDYVKNTKGTNYWRNRVMKVAKKLEAAEIRVNFAVSSADEFSSELTEYGLTAGDKPVVAGRNAKDQKFVMKDVFSVDNLEKFATDMMSGKLDVYLKSEDIPEKNDEPVKVVVAKNFEEIVMNKDKDVLIEFYAPWCGHCKKLAPKFDELATKLLNDDSIVIAKMDATANDVPSEFNVQGFPTLFFVPKDNKPISFEGEREVGDFIKYIAKHSTDGLKDFDRDGNKKKTEL